MIRLACLLAALAAAPAVAQSRATPDDLAATIPPSAAAPVASVSEYDVEAAPAFYVSAPTTPLRALPEPGARVLQTLRRRDGVRVLDVVGAPEDGYEFGWRLVQYGSERGYVRTADLSNLWIRVDKSERTFYVYEGDRLIRALPADVSASDEDKVRRSQLGERDHYRIPEGVFFVTRLHPESQYYRAFVLSYPNAVHALRGVQEGIITEAQYQAIVRADQEGVEPPMNTPLGGLIEIHGQGSGRQRAWTRGCVALRNVHMDELWDLVTVGTPVVIEP